MARFEKTFCSSCGGVFGPGDEGFSHCDQHADLKDADEDALDWEEFQSMSEAQTDAQMDRLMKEYGEMLDGMSLRQLYQYRRQRSLALCLKQRRLVKKFPGLDCFEGMLRSTQRRLLIWRIEYQTGTRVGRA